jgi:hypothetical protein
MRSYSKLDIDNNDSLANLLASLRCLLILMYKTCVIIE